MEVIPPPRRPETRRDTETSWFRSTFVHEYFSVADTDRTITNIRQTPNFRLRTPLRHPPAIGGGQERRPVRNQPHRARRWETSDPATVSDITAADHPRSTFNKLLNRATRSGRGSPRNGTPCRSTTHADHPKRVDLNNGQRPKCCVPNNLTLPASRDDRGRTCSYAVG